MAILSRGEVCLQIRMQKCIHRTKHMQIADQTGTENKKRGLSQWRKHLLMIKSRAKTIVATKARTLMFQPLLQYHLGRVLQCTAADRSIIAKVGFFVCDSTVCITPLPHCHMGQMLKNKTRGANDQSNARRDNNQSRVHSKNVIASWKAHLLPVCLQ